MRHLLPALALLLSTCTTIKSTEDFADYMQVPVSHFNAPFSLQQIEDYADSIKIDRNYIYYIDTACVPNASFILGAVKIFDKQGKLSNWRGCNADFPGYLEMAWTNSMRYEWLKDYTLEKELQCLDTSIKDYDLDEEADFYVVYYWARPYHRFNLNNLKSIIEEIETDKDRKIQLFAVNYDNRAEWGWSKEEYKRKRIERRTMEVPPRDKWYE